MPCQTEVWGRHALRVAAQNARVASVEHLLARGGGRGAHDRVEAILRARSQLHEVLQVQAVAAGLGLAGE
jgi:hypothetical protein